MTDTVVVTGGLGRSGRWTVDRLAGEYEVICVDLEHPGFEVDSASDVDFRAVDLTDRGEVLELIGEIDPGGVVHWGAIPAPERHSGGRVFENNTQGVYNVLVAAGRVGAKVVQASSESAYGFPFSREPYLPEELPITEAHPLRPEDPYGTSKVIAEEVAGMVTRQYGIPIASIRPSWIQYPGEYACRENEDLAEGAGNFWSYVDVRDVAGIVETALDAEFEDHEAFNAMAAENYLDRPTAEAIEDCFDGLPSECSIEGEESAFSTAKAESVLDWIPEHDWRTASEEPVASPVLYEG
ncbi:NAD(P)-dependent oxidoreductase [Halobacteriales archaeon QS_3_64_16]|nr:MAG: NAD(P)-dependent oxidoreductase [Halobacteriales archaeon QS_3_64_16]